MKNVLTSTLSFLFVLVLTGTMSAQFQAEMRVAVMADDVLISWSAVHQEEISAYMVHRIKKGTNTPQLVVNTAGNGNPQMTYVHTDMDLADGVYTYRLTARFTNGMEEIVNYSTVEISTLDPNPKFRLQDPTSFDITF